MLEHALVVYRRWTYLINSEHFQTLPTIMMQKASVFVINFTALRRCHQEVFLDCHDVIVESSHHAQQIPRRDVGIPCLEAAVTLIF